MGIRGRAVLAALIAALALASTTAHAGALEDALAAYNRGDYAKALALWQPLAAVGDADAEFWLGALYDLGRGVPQSYDTATRMYRKAAEHGQVNAQFNLGQMYEVGEGVSSDYGLAAAAAWYRRAAEQGYRAAQGNLGLLYATGRGVRGDYVEAYKWLALAGETQNLDFVARKMTPPQIDTANKLVRDWQPKRER